MQKQPFHECGYIHVREKLRVTTSNEILTLIANIYRTRNYPVDRKILGVMFFLQSSS